MRLRFALVGGDKRQAYLASLQADFSLLSDTVEAALAGRQLQPLLR